LAQLNVVVSVFFSLLGMFVGLVLFRYGQSSTPPSVTARATAEANRITDEAKAKAEAELAAARAEAAGLLASAKDAERLAHEAAEKNEAATNALAAAKREADVVRKEAAIEAKQQALATVEQAKAEALRAREEIEKLAAARDERAARRDELARQKDSDLSERDASLAERAKSIKAKESEAEDRRGEAVRLVSEQRAKLEAIAGVSGEQVRRELIEEFLDEARRASARESKAIEDIAREEAEKRAKRIIGLAIQRYAGDYVQERAVTSVHLPTDEMKGRIIGREGRNIRALQEACGVDFIVDDTPETIVISGFDPIRREVARLALDKLIQDGRIHPARIEEVVLKAQAEVDGSIAAAGEQALIDLGLSRLHPELLQLLGRLKYRYSYAQNVLKHSLECGFLCGLMASELGQDEHLAKRAALLHDIGKAVSHEQEGGHAVIGGQYARKYGEDPIVANGIACHHDDEPAMSVIGNLVTAADALSGARPGARREKLEGYVKRLSDLEAISKRFVGVERSYAIQAGREVRVIVEPSEVSDAEAALLAREISKKIEEELAYPGQIRVTIVRETRAVDYAK
jgi:ribonuclease Y